MLKRTLRTPNTNNLKLNREQKSSSLTQQVTKNFKFAFESNWRLENKVEVIMKLIFSCTGKRHFTSLFNTVFTLVVDLLKKAKKVSSWMYCWCHSQFICQSHLPDYTHPHTSLNTTTSPFRIHLSEITMAKDSSAFTYPRLLLVNYVILSKASMFNSLHNTIFLVQHRAILRLLVCGD